MVNLTIGSQSAIRLLSRLYMCVSVNIPVTGGGGDWVRRWAESRGAWKRARVKTTRKGRQDLFDMNYLMYII